MRISKAFLSFLASCAVAIPLEALHPEVSEVLANNTVISKRISPQPLSVIPTLERDSSCTGQDDYNWQYFCQHVSPDNKMPPRTEAYAIADYLTSLGDKACGMERPQGSSDPVYQNLAVTTNVEVNIYFTNKVENKWAYKVDYYCSYLGTYLKSLVRTCSSNDQAARVQGK